MWNTPYSINQFRPYAEQIGGEPATTPTLNFLRDISRELTQKNANLKLVAGSISEIDSVGDVFNTCLVFGNDGQIEAKHRKIHLFDIDVPGQYYKVRIVKFYSKEFEHAILIAQESETLTAGDSISTSTFYHEPTDCTIGLGICYDIRFPLHAHLLTAGRDRTVNPPYNSEVLIYPASFNPTTGPLHFSLLGRARALDTQTYVILAAPARNLEAKPGEYVTWGHSQIISPSGQILREMEIEEGVIFQDLDLSKVTAQRKGLNYKEQRREDLWKVTMQNQ